MPHPSEAEKQLDISKMTKPQKLATLLIVLGADAATEVMKQLDDHTLEAVVAEMTRLHFISHEMQQEILREFSDMAVQASTCILGGLSYAQGTLERSIGLFRASDIMNRVSPARPAVTTMEQITEMEPRQIFNLLRDEQPQTMALVLSYLPSDKGSQILVQLRADLRDQVVERLATLAPTPVEVVEKVVEVLKAKAGNKQTRAMHKTGGIKIAADLLNALDKNASKTVLVNLEERNPELGQAIRQKMFTFEDLASLDTASLQKILREVEMRDLAVSLKTASEGLKKTLLSCISRRAAETVNEEMSFMGPVKIREVESAQSRIIDAVRRLESEGEIELGVSEGSVRDEALV